MGSSSVPSSTAQYQQLATGIWGSPQATKLAMPILKPALGNIKEQQDMLIGVQHGDPTQLAAFFGLPSDSGPEAAGAAAHRYMSGPRIDMPSQPPAQQQQPPSPPSKVAAQGGLMSLDDDDDRRFASGGNTTPKDISAGQAKTLANLQKQIDANRKLSPANQKKYDFLTQTRQAYQQYTAQQDAGKANLAAQGITPSAAYLGRAGFFGGQVTKDPITGQDVFTVTNPYYNQAVNVLQGMNKQPEQFGQATQAYQDAISGLKGAAQYQARDVNATRADVTGYDPSVIGKGTSYDATRMTAPTQAEVKNYAAAQMAAASMQGREAKASQINRGDVRDINAIMADVERYQAAGMQAPPALQAEAYQAAQMQGAQLQGPKSWTDEGTAQKYMSPYQQNVTDIAKRESMRDYGKQLAQLRSQATQSKAFGGTRSALQEAEAQRNQAQRMGDIEAQGLQQAYQSGMGQFSAEQGLGLQAGQSNLQAALTTQQQNQAALNQQRSLYVQQALDAAKTSYGGELTAAQANQVAQNAASQFNAGAQNLAYNNYAQQQLAAQQANQSMDWNVANQNAQLAQQAELANQQYGIGGFQSNLNNAQFQQQAAQQNQAAINQQRQSYVNNALQAAMQAYGGQLTAEQQNQAAANAAAQFNAGNQQQINLADQASRNAASQLYANAQNQAGLQYAQQNLQGQMANQQAGLQANQQNIGAYGAIGNMGQGLGSLGTQIGNYGANLANMWGQAGSTLQGLGQGWYNQQQQNAANIYGGPTTLANQGVGILGGMGGGQSGVTAGTQKIN